MLSGVLLKKLMGEVVPQLNLEVLGGIRTKRRSLACRDRSIRKKSSKETDLRETEGLVNGKEGKTFHRVNPAYGGSKR